jgi:enterochelin esterase-like enzyme
MKKTVIIFLVLILPFGGFAQTVPDFKSIEINPDKTVTFRYDGVNAKNVKLGGNFLPLTSVTDERGERKIMVPTDMVKNEKGIWEYTAKISEPDLYNYYFIVDDIRVNDPKNSYQTRGGSIFIINEGISSLYCYQDVPHGTVSYRWYNSPFWKTNRRCIVYTPAGYEQSKEKYPVLYLLHGNTEDEEAWLISGRAVQIIDNLIAQGKAKPMIVVMPNGNTAIPAALSLISSGSMIQPYSYDVQVRQAKSKEPIDYFDYEKSFKDVVNFVESNYRVIPEKNGRAIAGSSMGGRNAMNTARIHENTFGYVGLFSPAMRAGTHYPHGFDDEIMASLIKERDNGVKMYWIGCGTEDGLITASQEYTKILDKINFPYEFHTMTGAHTFFVWRNFLVEFSQRLFK